MVLSTAAIAGGSLFAPVIYSLFSKRQTAFSLIFISVASLLVSLFFKVISPSLLGISLSRTMETLLGVGFPIVLLLIYEVYAYFSKKNIPYLQIADEGTPASLKAVANKQNIFGIQ